MSRYTYQSKSLLKDNSWIKKDDEEDEYVDRDPNFAKSVLGRYKVSETTSPTTDTKTTTSVGRSSVSSLSKRFTGDFEEPKSSTLPSSRTSSSYTRSSYSSLNSPTTIVPEDPKASTTTTTTTSKDGKTTETTVTTTTRSSKTSDLFSERVLASSKGYTSYSPTRTTKVTETTSVSGNSAEDKLFDTLIPSGIKDDYSPTDRRTLYTTETVTVKSSGDNSTEDKLFDTLVPKSSTSDVTDSKTTTTTEWVTVKSSPDVESSKTITTSTRTSSTAEDKLYDTLLPIGITSPTSSPRTSSITQREIISVESTRGQESSLPESPSYSRISSTPDDYSSTTTTKRYSYSKPENGYEYTSITSPSSYSSTTYRSTSRSDDNGGDVFTRTSSSSKSLYSPSTERTVLEKDLCSICRKPFTADAKMILDDLKLNCHAYCFKCEVCNCSLGHLKAGDSMWVYKRMVHCENCFEVTREKWSR